MFSRNFDLNVCHNQYFSSTDYDKPDSCMYNVQYVVHFDIIGSLRDQFYPDYLLRLYTALYTPIAMSI